MEALGLHILSSLRGLAGQERAVIFSNLPRVTSDLGNSTPPVGERIVLCNVTRLQGVTFDVQSFQA
jgi:hypothetical protein